MATVHMIYGKDNQAEPRNRNITDKSTPNSIPVTTQTRLLNSDTYKH